MTHGTFPCQTVSLCYRLAESEFARYLEEFESQSAAVDEELLALRQRLAETTDREVAAISREKEVGERCQSLEEGVLEREEVLAEVAVVLSSPLGEGDAEGSGGGGGTTPGGAERGGATSNLNPLLRVRKGLDTLRGFRERLVEERDAAVRGKKIAQKKLDEMKRRGVVLRGGDCEDAEGGGNGGAGNGGCGKLCGIVPPGGNTPTTPGTTTQSAIGRAPRFPTEASSEELLAKLAATERELRDVKHHFHNQHQTLLQQLNEIKTLRRAEQQELVLLKEHQSVEQDRCRGEISTLHFELESLAKHAELAKAQQQQQLQQQLLSEKDLAQKLSAQQQLLSEKDFALAERARKEAEKISEVEERGGCGFKSAMIFALSSDIPSRTT